VPSTRRQDGGVAMAGRLPEGCTGKIKLALRPMRRYLQHRCTFTLRVRNGIEPTWVGPHVGFYFSFWLLGEGGDAGDEVGDGGIAACLETLCGAPAWALRLRVTFGSADLPFSISELGRCPAAGFRRTNAPPMTSNLAATPICARRVTTVGTCACTMQSTVDGS
jgi:hypothetical protein